MALSWDSQARILEWVDISFSKGPSRPRDQTCISKSPALQVGSAPLHHQEGPQVGRDAKMKSNIKFGFPTRYLS